jgi:ParB family transcriptional regulator, chromosome partitioning protein
MKDERMIVMKEIRKIDLGLNGYEELFMSSEERADAKKPKVEEIAISELFPFRNHPFKVKQDEELKNLMESIRNFGVLVPALARPKEGGYELVSGHRRMTACKALGIEKMPVIIRDLTDEEAVITMVDANLQREHILPSEKAFAYKMKMEALKSQGKRTDITSSQVATRFDAASEIGKGSGESRDQVFRYIRLTNLIPEILQMVDDGKIALTPAVELSYLTKDEQNNLYTAMDYDGVTPSLSQAQRLHRLSGEQNLSEQVIADVLSEVKGNQKECVRIPVEDIGKYFRPGTSMKQMAETIVKAMDYYNRHLERNRDRER